MLSKRLQTILDMITFHDYVADIGADHGYLLLGCLKKGVSFVQGIENKIGPWTICTNNLDQYIKENRAIVNLSNGLINLDDKIDTCVIAGMGGELIKDILSTSLDVAHKQKKLILQPNNKEYELRKFLNQTNFKIIDEKIIFDMKKYYEIIVCISDEDKTLNYNELLFGPILLKDKSEIFLNKWKKILLKYKEIVKNTKQSLPEIEQKIQIIKDVLK